MWESVPFNDGLNKNKEGNFSLEDKESHERTLSLDEDILAFI